MPEVLFLSHWDAAIPITIPHNVVKDLTNYNILGIRFLYNCFQKGYRGAILNEEQDMNPHIQISSFLNALNNSISVESPAIIVCSTQSLQTWHYYLNSYAGNAVVILSEQNSEQILQRNSLEIILASVENLKYLKGAEIDFFTVILDDVDLLINKKFVKQIKGQFHIGVTERNFLMNPDQKLFRNILLWANPNCVGKLEQFCLEDNEHFDNNRFAYANYWFRLTWSFCDSFKKPTEDELRNNRENIHNWAKIQNLQISTESCITRVRKRKREDKKDNSNSNSCIKQNSTNKTGQISSPSPIKEIERIQGVNSSQETVTYEYANDDYPLLTEIVNDSDLDMKCEAQSVEVIDKTDVYESLFEEEKIEKCGSSEDILLSIMNDDYQDDCNNPANPNISSTKSDVLSMLYSDSE